MIYIKKMNKNSKSLENSSSFEKISFRLFEKYINTKNFYL